MRQAPILLASAIFGLSSVAMVDHADAKVRIVPFTKSGNWNVRAVYGSSGKFDHCSANTRYRSGTRVSIIVYRSGNWRLWFAHDAWPDRGRARFPATVQVDGRTVLSQNGQYKGRNAYINLGRDVTRVKAIMRGNAMAIITPAGTSRFSLKGTNNASRAVARCWKAHYRRPAAPGGAFGSANNNATGGAFGGGTTVRRRRARLLSRAATMEIATRYLSKAKQPYAILPRNKSPLKLFPVNWRMRDGTLGGMRIFRNTRAPVSKVLGSLLSNQAKHCAGRNASEREPARKIRGRNIIGARGVCETSKGSVLNLRYKVAELGRGMVMMIMEVRKAGSAAAASDRRRNVPAPNNSQNGSTDSGEIRIPGPDEL